MKRSATLSGGLGADGGDDALAYVLATAFHDSAGTFTGRALGRYFSKGKAAGAGARKNINGTDRADLVALHVRVSQAGLEVERARPCHRPSSEVDRVGHD
jgi:hypothetical protein